MDDTLEGLDEDEELEEEADEEVEKVLFELTDGKLGQAGKVGGELPVSASLRLVRAMLTMYSFPGHRGRGGGRRAKEFAFALAGSPKRPSRRLFKV